MIELFESSRLSAKIPVNRSQGKAKYRPDVGITLVGIVIAKLGFNHGDFSSSYCLSIVACRRSAARLSVNATLTASFPSVLSHGQPRLNKRKPSANEVEGDADQINRKRYFARAQARIAQ
jgi:hypothetical protein